MTWTVTCPDCGQVYAGPSARDADLAAERHTKRDKHVTVQRGLP